MRKKITIRNAGFTLVELMIYIGILVIIFLLVVNSILSYTSSYRQLAVLRAIDQSAITSMERMTRDIRNATSVATSSSVFNSNPGTLTLTEAANSSSTTTVFYIQNGELQVDVNNVNIGPLTSSNVGITNLTFTYSTSSVSQAVKIDMTLVATSSPIVKTKSFHSTIVLKGS